MADLSPKVVELRGARKRFGEIEAVKGVDLAIAQARNPDTRFHHGNMIDFDLGRRFDAVVCLFSSIGYAPDLEAAVANLRRHVATGGVLVVEPWLSPEMIIPGHVSLRTAETDTLKVARMDSIEVAGRLSVLNCHYLVGRGGAVEHLTERHETWLWTREEYAGAFAAAGLEATYDEEGLMGRGLWLGVSR